MSEAFMVTTGDRASLHVEKLVYGGEGLSREAGRVVLTPFVLPGEEVLVEPEESRGGVARARLVEIRTPSAERVNAGCPYFGRCGGCHYQHASYPAQIASKVEILRETLARVGKLRIESEIAALTAEPWGYRNRAQFHFEAGKLGYHGRGSHRLVAIGHCPISSPKINECIGILTSMVHDRRWPRFLRQLEVFTDEQQVQLNVIETDQPVARRFFDWAAEQIPGLVSGAIIYDGFRVSRGSFFQVNRFLRAALVEAALEGASGRHAVDLYAGVGLFSLPLARRFARVSAVESGSGAVRDLVANAETAGVRVEAAAAGVEEFLRTLESTPDFVLADPPRTGLGKAVVGRLLELRPPNISVVSCDPATLARDAAALVGGGYRIERLVLADLFPQTFHIETVARFTLAS